jgi:hypothetical protein
MGFMIQAPGVQRCEFKILHLFGSFIILCRLEKCPAKIRHQEPESQNVLRSEISPLSSKLVGLSPSFTFTLV